MYDIHILKLLGSKDLYDRFIGYVKDNTVSGNTLDIVKVITEYYKCFPTTTQINWNDFSSFYMLCKGKSKPEKLEVVSRVLKNVADLQEQLDKDPTSSPMHEEVVAHLIKLDFATKIAERAYGIVNQQVSKGESDDLASVGDMVQQYEKEARKAFDEEAIFISPSISTLATSVLSGGLFWPLKELNISLGPLRTGDFVIVGARPETGKSTFGCQCASTFATQAGVTKERPLIYVGNEEAASRIVFRMQQSYFGVTAEELAKNAAKYDAKYAAEVGDKIKILDDNANINSVSQLRKLFKEYNPSVIIIDQLDNVSGYSHEDKEHMRIGLLYRWARNLAKEYGPVIAMSQVDGSGEGQQWITMAQLRESKTDKAAAADAIITIGRTADKAKEYSRYIHLPKNKLLGLPGTTQEAYRHGFFEVEIKPSIGRYIGKL